MRASAAILALGLVLAPCARAGDFAMETPHVRKAPPAFALPTLAGDQAELPGKAPAIIHFWASWCPSCAQEMPELVRFARRHELRLVLVAVDRNADNARAALRRWGIALASLWDRDGRAHRAWAVRVLPVSYFIAADGKFCGRVQGARRWDEAAWQAWRAHCEASAQP